MSTSKRITVRVVAAMTTGAAILMAGAPQASAEQCYSEWKVSWPTAGAYSAPDTNSTLLDTYHSGDDITSLTGEPVPGWVHLVIARGYMRKSALDYRFTFC